MQVTKHGAPRRLFAAIVAALLLVLLGTGCSSDDNSGDKSKPKSKAAAEQIPVDIAKPTPDCSMHKPEVCEALTWLQSKERTDFYAPRVPKAGILIAKALEAGKFGPTERFDEHKTPLQPGYVGWGPFQSKNKEQFAWVFWKADGSIDYTKPITQIAINNKTTSKASGIMIFGPSTADANDTHASYWHIVVSTGPTNRVAIDPTGIDIPDMQSPDGEYRSPTTLIELQEEDKRARDRLDNNMTAWFGGNWDK